MASGRQQDCVILTIPPPVRACWLGQMLETCLTLTFIFGLSPD